MFYVRANINKKEIKWIVKTSLGQREMQIWSELWVLTQNSYKYLLFKVNCSHSQHIPFYVEGGTTQIVNHDFKPYIILITDGMPTRVEAPNEEDRGGGSALAVSSLLVCINAILPIILLFFWNKSIYFSVYL